MFWCCTEKERLFQIPSKKNSFSRTTGPDLCTIAHLVATISLQNVFSGKVSSAIALYFPVHIVYNCTPLFY
jgi:hypothetical protein